MALTDIERLEAALIHFTRNLHGGSEEERAAIRKKQASEMTTAVLDALSQVEQEQEQEPVAWQFFHPTDPDSGEVCSHRLTDADKAYGWTERPLYPATALAAKDARIAEQSAEIERLRDIMQEADDAYCGLIQTELAPSAVGLKLAKQIVNEGYGLHLKIAMREIRQALGERHD